MNLLSYLSGVESARLNVPRVLLPFSENTPEFLLSGWY